MEDKCWYCNKRVVVGGISMCIYDIEDIDNIISGVDVSQCPNINSDKQCNEFNLNCKSVPVCWYKSNEVFKASKGNNN